jgi:release factor glutamine methyltransferase
MTDSPPALAPPRLPSAALPSLDHLTSRDFEEVYEPSDDTYLLIDTLSADVVHLRARRPAVCLEVGSGSGCVITHLASLLPDSAMLATDVNRSAALATRATGDANGRRIHTVHADLLSALRPGSVDVVVFNPPYVPTSDEELHDAEKAADISAAWAGGERGRRVLDRLMPLLGAALSPTGVFYLLGVVENDLEQISEVLRTLHGLESQVLAERRAQNERLFVARFWRGAGMA